MLRAGVSLHYSRSLGPLAGEELGETRRTENVMRFIVGILWIILLVFIALVFLNVPGIR